MPSDKNGSDNGWALASVLWALTMLSLMAVAAQDLVLTAHRSEGRAFGRASAEAVLDAGLTQAVIGIMAPSAGQRWRVDGAVRTVTFGYYKLQVAVQAETGLYDLNGIDASVLSTLLRAAGLDSASAGTLTDSILDWRSPKGPHRLNGATDDDYAAAGLPYRPRHAAFQSVEELQLVLGMTPELFQKIRPALTVYTKSAMIDPALAPKEALLGLYNGDEDAVDAALKARDAGDDSASPLYPSSHAGVINPGVSLVGKAFEISEEVQISTRKYRRKSVILMTGSAKEPYLTLAWAEQ